MHHRRLVITLQVGSPLSGELDMKCEVVRQLPRTRDDDCYNFSNSQGMVYELREVHRCLNAGLLESPVMPHASTVKVMRVLDECRAQVGVSYPGEKKS